MHPFLVAVLCGGGVVTKLHGTVGTSLVLLMLVGWTIGILVNPPSAWATVFDITYAVSFTDGGVGQWQSGSDGTIFGVTGPTTTNPAYRVDVTTSFQIDTDAAPVVFIPAGTPNGPRFPLGFNTDLFGYDISAISGFGDVTFGTHTWDFTSSYGPHRGFFCGCLV